MSIHRELITSDAWDHTGAMSSPSAEHKFEPWAGAIDSALDYTKHMPSQREYREEFCPRFVEFCKRHGIPHDGFRDRFAFSEDFPGSEVNLLPDLEPDPLDQDTQLFCPIDNDIDMWSVGEAINDLCVG